MSVLCGEYFIPRFIYPEYIKKSHDFQSALYLLILKLKLKLHVSVVASGLVVLGSEQRIGSGGMCCLRRLYWFLESDE